MPVVCYTIIVNLKIHWGEVLAAFTKDAIKHSFMKLLNEKQLNKITVKDIVEDCGINRNSFYYHYNDIPSLLEEILNEQADMLVSVSGPSTIYDCILSAIDFATQNKKAMLHIFNSPNREMIYSYINRVSQRAVSEYIDKYAVDYNISEHDKQAIIMYYKSLLIGFLVDWLSSNMKYDLKDEISRICELFEGSTETAFIRSSNEKSFKG